MNKRLTRFAVGILVVALVTGGFISLFASGSPDGLERVLEDHASDAAAHTIEQEAPLPDYTVPGIENENLSTALAGVFGTVTVLLVGYAAGRLMQGKSKGDNNAQ